jgi:Tol biopolymer transport system component/tRNA A-37 threonylcarbamoyl transferase component Bud32
VKELDAGTKLGHYEILATIGEGGMGRVLRARDLELGREVALKVLPSAVAEVPERLARFRREAKILASLNHPNIAAIHGLVDADGVFALSLELVPGEDLAQRLARGAAPVEDALKLGGQIAAGLEYAHERGVVHRDLKPANVKATPEGAVKILDFGLAKAYDDDPTGGSGSDVASFSPTLSRHMSAAGVILGTAAYMSPEQARGRPVDKRADIWSFGVVLFEMLTGQRLFGGDTITDVLAAVVRQEIAWEALPAGTPSALRLLLRRCLERDVARRLRDVGEARIAIADAIAQPAAAGVASSPDGGAERQKASALPWLVAGALAAALAIVAWQPWRRTPAAATSLRVSMELGADVVLPAGAVARVSGGPGTSAVLSPDGRLLVFVGESPAGTRLLYVRRLDQTQATPVSGTEAGRQPFLSPDSRWIGFFADNKLKKVAVDGGPTVTLCDAVDPRGGSWSEDGTIVFAVQGEAPLRRIPAGGGAAIELPTGGDPAATSDGRWPQILPGGRAVLFTSGVSGNYDAASLVVQRLPDGPRKVVHQGGYHGRYLPSGHLVYIRAGTLFAARFDPERLQVVGASLPVLQGVASNPGAGGAEFAASDSGSLVFLPGGSLVPPMPLAWLGKDGQTRPLRSVPAVYYVLGFSPDGQRLATDIRDGDEADVWIYEWAQDTMYRLTTNPGQDVSPVWSPDGRWIAFASTRGDQRTPNLYCQRADGTGEVVRLTESTVPQFPTSWHPSGRYLAFSDNTSRLHISILELSGGAATGWKPVKTSALQESSSVQNHAAFSPDGRWLAYSSAETGSPEVYVRPFPGDGARVRVSTSGGQHPMWSRKRSELFFRATDNTIMLAPYRGEGDTFHVDKPSRWSPSPVQPRGPFRNFDLHPDGDRFAVMTPVAEDRKRDHVTLVLDFADELLRLVPLR